MLYRRGLVPLAILVICLASGSLFREGSGAGAAMTKSAGEFLSTLTEEQRSTATMAFDEPKRLDWHFIPKANRKGLQIKDMNAEQRKAAHALLRSGLSELGYDKAVMIMDLESILHELEKKRQGGQIRDPERYYFTIFGKPEQSGTWGWSLEGHHLSLNYVVSKGECTSVTPFFFGANPAEVRNDLNVGPKKGTRVLPKREDIAFELLKSLDKDQRRSAVLADKAPSDIRAAGEAHPPQTPAEGLAASKMNEAQLKLLRDLLSAYTETMPKAVASERWSEIEKAGFEKIHFAWAGADRPGVGHSYRIQGPTFLVELNNTQPDSAGNPANHIHSIWRQMSGDFGLARNGK